MGMFLGILFGFVVGVVLTGLFWWAFNTVVNEEALDPLADLKIQQDQLSGSEIGRHIDTLARQYLPDHGGIAVGVIVGRESEVYGYGLTRQDGTTPDENTLFELASAGKTFTALVLADMSLKGELALTDPIEQYLPKKVRTPKYGDRGIQLIDLASQSSGLPSLTENFHPTNPLNPYADFTVEEMYEGLGMVKIEAPIGKSYAYSNLGFGLLGHILSLETSMDYEDLVIARICDPLSMHSTRMTLDENLKSRLAKPHDGGQAVEVWEDTTLAGAGSFLSTPHDMLLYVQAHWDEQNPLSEAMQLATRKRRPTDAPARAIGLGWFTDSENALDIVWHNGGAGGSRSYLAMIPDREVGVVILSNSSSTSVEEFGKKVLYLLLRHQDLNGGSKGDAVL
ncbi:MAG TPA: serine hydrolase domain-containing protein [Planctomycetaceae bacterium]|nr:serine hydrolase domain-containing protein [Planctomycetaceae bacterium]